MPSSETIDFLDFPLGVVAHDAGAANHIIAWLKGCDDRDIYACMGGPAARLWTQSFHTRARLTMTLPEVISQSGMLLTGTGWASALEHDARKLARSAGLKSVAVIDHWANYRERFIRYGEEVLPDEIWVTDEYAKKLAEREFPNLKVIQLPNAYLDSQVQEVLEQEHAWIKRAECNLLYVLEPIREAWGHGEQPGEFQALDFFMGNLSLLQLDSNLSIRLRPHPSDSIGKYDQWLEAQKNVKISLDKSQSLAESIAWADVVIGCHTYAMVVALAAGRRVISSIPSWAPSCILPQTGILKLADFVHETL